MLACTHKRSAYINKQFEISLYNDKGKVVTQHKNRAGNKDITLNTQHLPNGTYFLHIKEGNETIKKQIIKQH
ncbi:MAG: T9SS C-terminal target domain-containing protein [Sphingobacteriales bacterium]|nr:MAG: T9SS C-terminal target domain-containing protein [Sphingobacteriales bacterium]TAF80605.1 MAG: T9SS C-terminal target domain-containing protein [Sphingobacteriales bacterium]